MDMEKSIPLQFPVRCTYGQKLSFRNFYARFMQENGFDARAQQRRTFGLISHNLIGGSIRKSRVIVLAAYDTPRTRFFPRVRIFSSRLLSGLLAVLPAIALGALLLGLSAVFAWPPALAETMLAALLFAAYYMQINPNNANQTTSSLVVISRLIEACRGRSDVSFVLLDNSDVFGLGEKAFYKEFSEELDGKLLIKLELTGRGEHLHFEKSPAARDILLPEHGGITASSRPKKLARIRINCAKKAAFGLYMDDISTPADRQLDEHSLDLATKAALEIIFPTKRSSL